MASSNAIPASIWFEMPNRGQVVLTPPSGSTVPDRAAATARLFNSPACRGYCALLRFDFDLALRFDRDFAFDFDFGLAFAVDFNTAVTAAAAGGPGSFTPVSWNSMPSCEKRKGSPL